MLEFQIVALLGLLPFLLGSLQVLLLLFAAHTVQFATFEAARAGSFQGADPAVMRRAFAIGLLPLHAASGQGANTADLVTTVGSAFLRSELAVSLYSDLEILAPTAAAFSDFAVEGASGRAIRNDGLEGRPITPGASSGQSIQEANLLRIRARYCHPLIVPFIDRLLLTTLRRLDDDAFSQRCYAADRVPLAGDAVINMQSDVRFHGS
jgi:hypothetical protein